ncbi:hypothetical protein HDU83_008254 [Entophlyctis luteolus]|nr:hypothetical protein HDU83_008254 [Entophlyctis luteolus]KAJ3377789.1 hypothetical protein HDU84_008201 [Entophlyctis sp. JEL0112]
MLGNNNSDYAPAPAATADASESVFSFCRAADGLAITVSCRGEAAFTISDLAKPSVSLVYDTTGKVNARELKLEFALYHGPLSSFNIAASSGPASVTTCTLVRDDQRYRAPLDHQLFRFALDRPPVEIVSHDLASLRAAMAAGRDDEAALARSIKCAFTLPDGRALRWRLSPRSDGDVASLTLEWRPATAAPEKAAAAHWTPVAFATASRDHFLAAAPKKPLFSFKSKKSAAPAAAPGAQFATLTLLDAAATTDRIDPVCIIASLWATWYTDALNPDGTLREIIKKREALRNTQLRDQDIRYYQAVATANPLGIVRQGI